MDSLISTYKNNGYLHHAYLIEGTASSVMPTLTSFIEQELGIATKGNPDVIFFDTESFGVESSRDLKERHLQHSVSGGRSIFIITTFTLTHEAQNALLKIFEEPNPGTHFFVIVPQTQSILPTLQSRMVLLRGRNAASNNAAAKNNSDGQSTDATVGVMTPARAFLMASPAERLLQIKDIAEEKNKGDALTLIQQVEVLLAAELKKTPTPKLAKALEELLQFKDYIADRGSSVKMILEYLSLSLPRI